jgi:hypothetical protein
VFATVNQAGAIGAAGAMIMAGYRLKERRGPPVLAGAARARVGGCIFVLSNTSSMNIKNARHLGDALGIGLGVVAAADRCADLERLAHAADRQTRCMG